MFFFSFAAFVLLFHHLIRNQDFILISFQKGRENFFLLHDILTDFLILFAVSGNVLVKIIDGSQYRALGIEKEVQEMLTGLFALLLHRGEIITSIEVVAPEKGQQPFHCLRREWL
jgi:hypothetical protein